MLNSLFPLIRPWLFKLDPEDAHDFILKALAYLGFLIPTQNLSDSFYKNEFRLPNKIGLAAGFDKNAQAINSLFKLGFGFVEIGTVTPLPQQGNPKPRLFRLNEDQAIINRMGFNNDGAEVIASRLKKVRQKGQTGIIGVNLGANKDSDEKIKDYALCAEYFTDTASYYTINVSSPNTVGLRDLQASEYLKKLIDDVLNIANKRTQIPVFLKISPDQNEYKLDEILEIVNQSNITGLIASNTTISRPENLIATEKTETGGLSGKPLQPLADDLLSQVKKSLDPQKILISTGGITKATDAIDKLNLGADLVQIYSGLVFHGFSLIHEIYREIYKRNFHSNV